MSFYFRNGHFGKYTATGWPVQNWMSSASTHRRRWPKVRSWLANDIVWTHGGGHSTHHIGHRDVCACCLVTVCFLFVCFSCLSLFSTDRRIDVSTLKCTFTCHHDNLMIIKLYKMDAVVRYTAATGAQCTMQNKRYHRHEHEHTDTTCVHNLFVIKLHRANAQTAYAHVAWSDPDDRAQQKIVLSVVHLKFERQVSGDIIVQCMCACVCCACDRLHTSTISKPGWQGRRPHTHTHTLVAITSLYRRRRKQSNGDMEINNIIQVSNR